MISMANEQKRMVDNALAAVWGFPGFRPHQEETVNALLAARDSLTVLPTGGGKSLCYQLPAALMNGTAIIVSPLISLMADQVNDLTLLGIPAAFLNSSLKGDEVREIKAKMFRGELKMLYLAPERLMLEHFSEELRQIKISFIAIDEAHCISQWGHDFRPEYKQLKRLRDLFPGVGIHAFTATAPPVLQQEIVHELRLNNSLVLVGGYYRANLFYRVYRKESIKRQILNLIRRYGKDDCGIIYCLSRKETESVADHLNSQGFRALPYHAGLSAETRTNNQVQFQREQINIMVATVAFGMGIDQSNVRFVIHAGMPRTLSHYQQESGRAGRDGLTSQCILIYGARDIQWWRRVIEEERVMVPQRLQQLNDMIGYASKIHCRHKVLVEYFGQAFPHPKCQGCDVCAGEVDTIPKAREYSRMIISAVLKLRQCFGGAYVSQVLGGSRDGKVLANRHDQLSVYNLLSAFPQNQIHDWINQLESQGYLIRASGQFPVFSVSSTGYWLLRPEKYNKTEADLPVFLIDTNRKAERKAERKTKLVSPVAGNYDPVLFTTLRSLRAELSQKLGVPAFVVFGDKCLHDMALKKPKTKQEFLAVFGVGNYKLRKFGKLMMAAIREHEAGRS